MLLGGLQGWGCQLVDHGDHGLGFWSRCSSPQGGFSGVNPRGVVLSGRGEVPACLVGAGVKKLQLLEEEKGNHLPVWPGTGV